MSALSRRTLPGRQTARRLLVTGVELDSTWTDSPLQQRMVETSEHERQIHLKFDHHAILAALAPIFCSTDG